MADMDDTVEKAQQIAAEAVGQARGATPATPTLKSSIGDWLAEAESTISRNPLLAVAVAGVVGFAIATTLLMRRR